MNRYRLTDICDFQGGSQPPKSQWKDTYKNGYIRMLQIRDFTQKPEKIEYVKETNSIKKCSEDDILIARYGASIGKILTGLEGAYNVAIVKTIPNSKILSKTYLYYYLNSSIFQKYIKNVGSRAAQAGFNKKELNKLEIDLPTLDKQKIIVENLQKIQNIISKKEYQIAALDNLIKSLFVEIFENKDYEKKSLNSISLGKGEYGSGAKAGDYKENLPRYVRITDINENGTLDDNFSSPLNEKKIEKYSLNYGDIIFARTGATVGKTYMYSEKDGWCIFAGFCIRFKLNTKLVNPKYIFKFTQTEKYKAWIKNKQRIVAQPNINAKEYGEELLIPIPPIELQNKFAEFVNQIDKQKFEIQNGLNKMKELYETLINKYFG